MYYNPFKISPTNSMRSSKFLILRSTEIAIVPKPSYYRISILSQRVVEQTSSITNSRFLTTYGSNLQQSRNPVKDMSSPKEFPPQNVRGVVSKVMDLLREKGENVCVAETVSLLD
jgi:hypothetical protein